MNERYSRTSTAYDFDRFLPAEKKKAEIRALPRPKQNKKTNAGAADSVLFRRAKMLAAAGVIVFMLCANLYLRSEIADVQDQIQKNNKQIQTLKNEEIRMNMELESKLSFTNIEEAAKKLGMRKKDSGRITYIQLEEDDRVVVRKPASGLTANK